MRVLIGKKLDGESYDPQHANHSVIGHLTTGPKGFLSWFGPLVGVIGSEGDQQRIDEFRTALESEQGAFYQASFAKDPQGVAERLLRLRDEIYVSSKSTFDLQKLPAVSSRLAAMVGTERKFLAAAPRDGLPESLRRIITRLRQGLKHPLVEVELLEPNEAWPLLWQELWSALATCGATLKTRQPVKLQSPSKAPDSIIHVRASYLIEAADAVAAYLSATPNDETAVIRGKEPRALDLGLARLGLPALGHAESSSGHPVRSLLPLTLDLSIGPANPNNLNEFLNIEPSPLPPSLRKNIAYVLARQPGWTPAAAKKIVEDYISHLATKGGDPISDASKAEWLSWLELPFGSQNGSVSYDDLVKNLARLDDFAQRAARRPQVDGETRTGLASLRGDVTTFVNVINRMKRPQYSRIELQGLLAKTSCSSTLRGNRDASAIHAVDHPSALLGSVDTVIYWMGVQSTIPRANWGILTASETKELAAVGVQFEAQSLRGEEHARLRKSVRSRCAQSKSLALPYS